MQTWWSNLPWSTASRYVVLTIVTFCALYLAFDALRERRARTRKNRQLAEVSGIPLSPRISRAWLRAVRGDRA